MKWIQWFFVLAVGVAMGLGVVGCGGGDDGNGDPLVGTWKSQTFNGQAIPPGTITVTMTFRDNGTFAETMVFGDVTESSGTWSTANGVLTIIAKENGQTVGTDSVPYSISGNTLTISDSEGIMTYSRQ